MKTLLPWRRMHEYSSFWGRGFALQAPSKSPWPPSGGSAPCILAGGLAPDSAPSSSHHQLVDLPYQSPSFASGATTSKI